MTLDAGQWALGAAAALLVGVSKTGVPGAGILVVPVMAALFGSRLSVGTVLPMLIVGDIFAVTWYRRHARWDKLLGLVPHVLVGVASGALLLGLMKGGAGAQLMDSLIGLLVLAMLAVHLLRARVGDRIAPTSGWGMAATGVTAGFATTVSNAAGPIMQIYLTASRLPKEQFMGTTAWYFLVVNLTKVPVFAVLTLMDPASPMMTAASLSFNAAIAPVIVLGAFIGRWLLPRLPQRLFDNLMLALAAVAALNLLR
ncbi:MAG TPA: sulfite exporter TauE/SafE family protein [Chthonomonadales bacterium]|nr:sulfite exporter TauE/SafE family protein [Chthonomonadales bacterium]